MGRRGDGNVGNRSELALERDPVWPAVDAAQATEQRRLLRRLSIARAGIRTRSQLRAVAGPVVRCGAAA